MRNCAWFGAAVVLLAANTWAIATTKSESPKNAVVKPKREVPLSSSSGGSFHGPSYTYLPPATASLGISAGGYDSYNSHGSSAAGFGASEGGGGGGGAGIGYDFGAAGFHASAPKVETFIVHTEPSHGGYAGGVSSNGGAAYSGSGAGLTHVGHGSAGGSGYRYSSVAAPHYQSSASGLLGHSSFGSGGGSGGGGYKFHAKARPHVQTFIIPVSSLKHGAGSSGGIHSSGTFGGGHALHASGSSGSGVGFASGGYQYAPTFGSSLHSGVGSFGSSAHGGHFGGGGISFGGGHASSGLGAHGSNSVAYSPQQGYSYSGHGGGDSAAFGLSGRGYSVQDVYLGGGGGSTLAFANQGSYSGHEYAHSASSIPSTNYGVPAGPALKTYQGAGHSSSSYETPVYAQGHKGLGHFSFSASKPQALNTNFIASGSGSSSGHIEHSAHAPFKPSTLLGTTHEVSGPAAQYLPPTSAGYEYESPSVLHGGASGGGGASTSISEPESAYLPPVAAPGTSYLPPHQH